MQNNACALVLLALVACLVAGCGGAGFPPAVNSPGGFVPDTFRSVSPDGLKVGKMVHSKDPLKDGTVGIFDRQTGESIEYFRRATFLKGFAWHPDSRHFGLLFHYGDSLHSSNEVEIYDLEAGSRDPVAVVGVDGPYYHRMHFSWDGKWIVFPGERVPVPRLPD